MTIDKSKLHEGVGTQSHYMDLKIQPIEVIRANNMGFLDGNVLKYVMRFKGKNGVEDLRKARQYLEWLIDELVEPENPVKEDYNPGVPRRPLICNMGKDLKPGPVRYIPDDFNKEK
jgi:hypothetical protein